jgi:uridine kinase
MTSDPFVLGLGLTLLQTSLLSNLISLIVIVINVELPLQGRARPVRIGLAGDSGAGKNHLSKGLECIFTPKNTLIVEGDDYHLWERGHANWSVMTHLNPQANNLSKLSEHALQLTKGISVFHPHYDHGTGRFTAPRQMSPTKTVIFQGLHTLFLRGFRDELDLRVFLEPERNVRLAWKIKRDQEERGHSIEKVLANMEKREKDALLHINPQRNFADWIVEYYFVEKLTQEEIVAGKTSDLYQRHIFWNDAPVAELVDVLHRIGGCTVKVEVFPESFDRIALIVSGHPSVETIEEMADASFSNMRQITRSWMPPVWQPGFDGINQLIAISLLNAKLTAIK